MSSAGVPPAPPKRDALVQPAGCRRYNEPVDPQDMNKTLGWKLGLVVAILVIFLFGIFGLPKEFSGSGLLASLQNHIHLGLDLKGGTHLILQVQVNDAVNVDSDNAVERLKADLRARKIFADITKPDPA